MKTQKILVPTQWVSDAFRSALREQDPSLVETVDRGYTSFEVNPLVDMRRVDKNALPLWYAVAGKEE